MAENKTEQEAGEQLDADGLVIQHQDSRVMVVLPEDGFGDQILRYARSSLHVIHVGTQTVSTAEIVKGRLQDEFTVDGSLADADMRDFVGILVAGCDGQHPLAVDEALLRLVRDAAGADKLVAAWGNGLEVLCAAGVLKGKRVTGSGCADAAKACGARYTGRQVEAADNTITAFDESAGMRFGQALASAVGIG